MLFRLALTLCLLCSGLLHASEPPKEPILRIDPGMHTTIVRHIATDAQGRWAVTAADDKTARIWDIASGRQLNVLRPPQGFNHHGKLFAVAMSPDGATVAVGGWTSWPSPDSDRNSVYLFDRASARLTKRLSGLPSTIVNLAFSPTGRYLAVTMGNDDGVHVFRSDTWQLVGKNGGYGSNAQGVDFTRDGRLATSSYDGKIRLYAVSDSEVRMIAQTLVPGGKRPRNIAFSPDGRSLAVGINDAPAVNVLDGQDLSFLFAPDTADIPREREMSIVAWTADGQTLMAGGTHKANGRYLVRQWAQGGRGKWRDEPISGDTIMDMRPLPQGEMVFATADPTWGTLDTQGRRSRFVVGPIADHRGNREGFLVSRDGRAVRFGYDGTQFPTVFDVEHGIVQERALSSPLNPPRTSAPGLDIADWKNASAPKLNGKALTISQYESSRSLAIAPDGERFVIGADWNMRMFDRSGTLRWGIQMPGTPWSVNISDDNRTVVAALSDGTVRWYDIEDGREKLALFPHADRQRWVAWTPSGYYQASPGGEELIGWHINNGKEAAADFYPASRFRARFNRPDVLARALYAPSDAEALRMADADSGRRTEAQPAQIQTLLPPLIAIQSPNDGAAVSTDSVTIRYTTRSPADAPVTGLRARVNGQAVTLPGARNIAVEATAATTSREISIPIPAGDSEIQLFAENKNGVSTPATVRLTWAGKAPPPAREVAAFKPKLYVLAVGVSKYSNPEFNLDLAAKDATDFARVLTSQKGQLYADVQVRLLTDTKATKDEVLDGLDWLRRQVTARDVGIMFLAGHGINDNTGKYYFLPHNADPERLLRTGVPQTDIRDSLNSLAGKAVFFVDTCHSGNALGTAKTRAIGPDVNTFVNELASAENGVVVFTAATGRQYSLEDPSWGNGAFTKAVVEGLSGKADFQKTGKITHKGLDYYVAERVKELTKGKQSPVSIAPQGVTDFPIAVVGR